MNHLKNGVTVFVTIIATGLLLNMAQKGKFGTAVQSISKDVANGFGDATV